MNENVNAIELKKITKFIGKKKVIDNVSMEIKQGEIFGLLGPNGAGKTTIMRIITGLIKQNEGVVYINGLDLAKDHEGALTNIGAIIESPDLYKHLSGKMNLKIMANMSRDIDEKQIEEIIEFVGLKDRIKDKVSKYSLGMRQRLGIAAALISNPKVLILDEPLNGLDPDGVKEMRETFIELARKQNVCIILSSHILSEMEQVCDRFAIIDKGVLIETKNLSETNEETVLKFSFELLEEVESERIVQALKAIEMIPESVLGKEFTLVGERIQISQAVRCLVNSGLDLVSVIPHKKSLEDYFIKRVGELSK